MENRDCVFCFISLYSVWHIINTQQYLLTCFRCVAETVCYSVEGRERSEESGLAGEAFQRWPISQRPGACPFTAPCEPSPVLPSFSWFPHLLLQPEHQPTFPSEPPTLRRRLRGARTRVRGGSNRVWGESEEGERLGEGELGGPETCGLGLSPYRLLTGPALRGVWCLHQGRGGALGIVSYPFVSFQPPSSLDASLSYC